MPRVALVHDWLTGMRGGEKVLEVFADLFPDAPIYTLVHVPGSVSPRLESHRIIASPLRHLPNPRRWYRHALPLMPWLIAQLRLARVDLVLSSSSCVAKGIRKPAGARHACYVHAPMRYVHDRFDDYFSAGRAGLATRLAMRAVRYPLQRWDCRNARAVDEFAANSRYIAGRIAALYGRSARIIHPPVDVDRFAAARQPPDEYYLMVVALVPYKNVDVALEAFRGLDRKLVIVGSGPLLAKLRAAAPPNVELRGWVADEAIPDLVARCRAFLMPNIEDFGIAPVEAMAAGRPVIALAAGGVLDTVQDGVTGVLYRPDSAAALAAAVRRFELAESSFDPLAIQTWARRFDRPRFARSVREWLESLL